MAKPYSEDRDEARFDHSSPLQIKDLGSGEIFEARMRNYSNGGIYFESDGRLQKGTKIYICVQHSPYSQSSGILEYYTGEVMWRKDLKRSFFKYGYGIQLVADSTGHDSDTASDSKTVKNSRKNPRRPYFRTVRFGNHKGVYKGRTKNISPTGVFIATTEKLQIGQSIKLNLPLKSGEITQISGQIIWLNEEGFGLKFKKIT
jgi:Tfp pilus assembly protein PilZ